ncbi:four helix bundle protein [Candidatus Binatia bacterium]|nr:four helix bundle protein [Candidatus Binatia bacterium]
MASDLIPVAQKSYDLCAGLYTYVNRFPRAQRGLLGRVMLEDALQMLVSVTVANRRANKMETLQEASGRLDALRITLRLSKRLGFVSNGGYGLANAGLTQRLAAPDAPQFPARFGLTYGQGQGQGRGQGLG